MEDIGSFAKGNEFWNAHRIHHYPQGGGFMVEHKDMHFQKILKKTRFPFLQIMMAITVKSEDCFKGGSSVKT